MSEKAERVIAKSAYSVSDELKNINAVMCAAGYFDGYKIDETDINKMLKELYFIDSDDEIQKQKKLEYIKENMFKG